MPEAAVCPVEKKIHNIEYDKKIMAVRIRSIVTYFAIRSALDFFPDRRFRIILVSMRDKESAGYVHNIAARRIVLKLSLEAFSLSIDAQI